MKFSACIIISKNYLAYARTLAQSLRANHKNIKIYCLFLDQYQDYVDVKKEGFEAITLKDMGISDWEFFARVNKQNVYEMACLMKARLLKYLFNFKNETMLFYLDTDLFFYNGLTDVAKILSEKNIVLTPHLLKSDRPVNHFDLGLEQITISTGLFNLGFIGVRKTSESLAFLDWWDERNTYYCGRSEDGNYFYDQKWLDVAPIYFEDVHILKQPGLNVANWNLHERPLSKRENKYWVENSRLTFFHFSHLDFKSKVKLARYSKIEINDFPNLATIVHNYKQCLKNNGWEKTHRWPFSVMYELSPN